MCPLWTGYIASPRSVDKSRWTEPPAPFKQTKVHSDTSSLNVTREASGIGRSAVTKLYYALSYLSIGRPAAWYAFMPPDSDHTLEYPILISESAANSDRDPTPQ